MKRVKVKVSQRRLLTIKDAMRMFGVSRQTLHKWRKQRDMPYILYDAGDNSFIRFDYKDVIEWATAHDVRIVKAGI